MVLHTCNNRFCVLLDHLYLGTHKQNMDDMSRAGHPNRKLTDGQAIYARTVGGSQAKIASELGVCQKTVQMIRKGKNYRHVGVG